ncbi:MAG: adenylate/guanylate cyclase domain-containing protein [Proteobacteria bacterium]|nr:adenylate/guanylate cyclase domain-containing protein [Pseudomonadota bacterium]
MKRHDLGAAFAAVALGALFVASPLADGLRGLSLDLTFALRHLAFGPRHDAAQSPSVVVALDEETYRTPPFEGVPQAFWPREMAPVLGAVLDAGAATVAFDVIFPTSVERFIPGFERDWLRALRAGSREGRVILGKVQHGASPILPFQGQSIAVGHDANIRTTNLFRDPDEAIRRAPLFLDIEDASVAGGIGKQTSLGLEAAARAATATVELRTDGVWFAGRRVPGSAGNAMPLDFDGGGADIPAFSLADLRACVEKGDAAFFEKYFKGKVVFFGTVLDVEDRKLTSRRFMTGPEGAAYGPRCALPARTDIVREDVVRDAIPGVFIHATFANNLLRGGGLHELGPAGEGLAAALLVAATAAAALTLPAAGTAIAFACLALAWTALCVVALLFALVWPFLTALVAAAVAGAALQGYRFAVADKDKRLLRKSFGLYLAPAMVDRLMAAQAPPELGGEEREITVMFSDVAGFTGLSEGLTPQQLVQVMNAYLSAMTDIVEAQGGFVDKYIGDAIVAVFGAPMDDPAHARRAVEAALACTATLGAMNEDPGQPFLGHKLKARIGLNSGRALVGNIGSKRRFNYTVMGDTVNLASRLEGANKYFGTNVMCAESVRALADSAPGPGLAWRELDRIQVKGREKPVTIYEPLDAGSKTDVAAFAAALALYRAGDFASAHAKLTTPPLDGDPAAISLAGRVDALRRSPPGPGWIAVTSLDAK